MLEWNGKKKLKDICLVGEKVNFLHTSDIYTPWGIDTNYEGKWSNLLIWGENKLVLNTILKDFKKKISLIYIDPPFATGGDFNLKVQIGEEGKIFNNIAYKDKWNEGIETYLDFLYERLILMKMLLADNGSIYVHLDWHISHYIKLIMDEIFGHENFRNEIIWAYPAASVKTRRFFIRSYDTILFYSKSNDYIFNDNPKIYQEFSDRVKNALKKDDKGTFYYRGGSHNGKKLSQKVYIDKEGIFPRDVWNDIPYIRANTTEYQGFSTQKPERLLRRIILASTNENDLVGDFFCGSGTTLAVAEKLGRRWIGCDSNNYAIHMAKKRVLSLQESNDILNWNKKYKKLANNFKILRYENDKSLKSILSGFLKNNIQMNNGLIKNTPSFNVNINQNGKNVELELIDYKVPFIELLSDEIKKHISSFSDWIDYWAIDFESNENGFKIMWSSYRTPKNKILNLKSDLYHYDGTGNYHIAVKIVDIFGFEIMKHFKINIIS
ncbi:MAG: site-specific DNA-methyltransferase [Candidatus Hermodarchaeota archaeon]